MQPIGVTVLCADIAQAAATTVCADAVSEEVLVICAWPSPMRNALALNVPLADTESDPGARRVAATVKPDDPAIVAAPCVMRRPLAAIVEFEEIAVLAAAIL